MIDLHPAVWLRALPVAQRDGVDAGIFVPNRRAVVLRERSELEGKRIEVRSVAGQFEADDRLDERQQLQPLLMRTPVVKPVVFGRRREFNVLGGEIDEAVVRAAGIVAARRRMIVIVGTDPAPSIDDTRQLPDESESLASLHRHLAGEMRILDAARDDDTVPAGRERDAEFSVFTVTLLAAAVSALFRPEIHRIGAVERVELCFARDGDTRVVLDVESDRAAGGHRGRERRGLASFHFEIVLHVGASLIREGDTIKTWRQSESGVALRIGIAESHRAAGAGSEPGARSLWRRIAHGANRRGVCLANDERGARNRRAVRLLYTRGDAPDTTVLFCHETHGFRRRRSDREKARNSDAKTRRKLAQSIHASRERIVDGPHRIAATVGRIDGFRPLNPGDFRAAQETRFI